MRSNAPDAPTSLPSAEPARVTRSRFLKQAMAAVGLAAVGMKTVGEKTAQAAATFGDNIVGSGLFGLRIRNSSTAVNATAIRGEMTSTNAGVGAAALRGMNAATTAKGFGVFGSHAGSGNGVRGVSTSGIGVFGVSPNGVAGVLGQADRADASGVYGRANGSSAAGMYGRNESGPGVWGYSPDGYAGVYGVSDASNGNGVYGIGNSPGATGVRGTTSDGLAGVYGQATSSDSNGVYGVGNLANSIGVRGFTSNGLAGVYGDTTRANGSGVYGHANGAGAAGTYGRNESGNGVWGLTPSSASGVYGESGGVGGRGVRGVATAAGGCGVLGEGVFGVYASGSYVGIQAGTTGTTNNDVAVRGVVPPGSEAWAGVFDGKCGAQSFHIFASAGSMVDHPLDPENQYLHHSFIESSEMKNIYDGVVTTDASGNAVVELPAWFEAVNEDFRYQLTVVGEFAQAIVSRKISDNRFSIRTSKPAVEVSWQVTGIRKAPWAADNRSVVESEKAPSDKGTYLHPQAYGKPDSMAPAFMRRAASEALSPDDETPAPMAQPSTSTENDGS